MGNSSEPTVEEILESITQVIARDNRAGAADLRRERETRGLPDDDVLDLGSDGHGIEEFEEEEVADVQEDGPLLGDATQADIGESLAALAMLAKPGAQPQIVRSGETSIESLVREMLRPALAEWLEKNLPPLVEKLVADEIRRISGNRS